MKKLLILSASTGAGHMRAAEALRQTALLRYPEVTVVHFDVMDYVSIPMRRTVLHSYDILVKRLPELWGFFYDKLNGRKSGERFKRLTKRLTKLNSTRLYQAIADFAPDEIICTHFLPADLVLNAPKRFGIGAPVSVVITDYDIHALWLVPGTIHFFVGTQQMAWKIHNRGWKKEDVTVSGIPIAPAFSEDKSIETLRAKHHISSDKKTILVLSGGQGLAHTDRITRTILAANTPATVIVIAGKSKILENKLRTLRAPAGIDLRVVGWTDEMDEYMRLADVIVSKSGGLTTSECMVLGKAMIAIEPIPGQEEHNAQFILERQAGVVAHTPDDLLYYLEHPDVIPTPKKQNLRPAAEIILDQIFDVKN